MRKIHRQKKGQFIIIAVLLISIMIISIGGLLYSAVTYYKHEPWEEYLTLIGNIELGSRHLVELSLSNYTHTLDTNVLRSNLENWESNFAKIYPGYGISLSHSLPSGTAYHYSLGLAHDWNKTTSFSATSATFSLDVASVGLSGYEFSATAFLNLTILSVDGPNKEVNVTVRGEDGALITGLTEDNFKVDGVSIDAVIPRYDQNYILVYVIGCESAPPPDATVRVWDQLGIQVVAKYT